MLSMMFALAQLAVALKCQKLALECSVTTAIADMTHAKSKYDTRLLSIITIQS